MSHLEDLERYFKMPKRASVPAPSSSFPTLLELDEKFKEIVSGMPNRCLYHQLVMKRKTLVSFKSVKGEMFSLDTLPSTLSCYLLDDEKIIEDTVKVLYPLILVLS